MIDMDRKLKIVLAGCCVVVLSLASVQGQQSVTPIVGTVNNKMVKLFGIGGFKGLPSYGTGILVSSKGHILTINNHILNTPGILVHLYDGRQYQAKVLVREPELDVALLKIDDEVDRLPHFDFGKEAARPRADNGDWVLAFSNQFKIALRDEPMSVQRGVIAAYTELRGRRGIFDAPFTGDVYFLDAIANNPGAAGGIVTTRKGDLLGILGRELKDTRTDTWINYAVPIRSVVEVQREDPKSAGKFHSEKVSMAKFVDEAIKGTYIPGSEKSRKAREDKGGYHGIVLVVNAVSSTPPYVEEVMSGSPAAKAGLRPDDLILYVEGESVPTIKMFREAMKSYAPDTEVLLRFQRGNKLEGVKLKLTSQPKVTAAN
jgi:serine protease Do